jgi:hypothetical protein
VHGRPEQRRGAWFVQDGDAYAHRKATPSLIFCVIKNGVVVTGNPLLGFARLLLHKTTKHTGQMRF